jgi:hypothetical protein
MAEENTSRPKACQGACQKSATQAIEKPPVPGKQLFGLGSVYATPAVLRHLEKSSVYPATLLASHQAGHWGELDDDDSRANDTALRSGARILSRFVVAGEPIYVITDAATDEGARSATTLLFAKEY